MSVAGMHSVVGPWQPRAERRLLRTRLYLLWVYSRVVTRVTERGNSGIWTKNKSPRWMQKVNRRPLRKRVTSSHPRNSASIRPHPSIKSRHSSNSFSNSCALFSARFMVAKARYATTLWFYKQVDLFCWSPLSLLSFRFCARFVYLLLPWQSAPL